MPRTVKNSQTSKLSKTPQNSKPSKPTKKIIKIQIDTSKCDETHCNNLIDECNCKIRTSSCDECEKKLINCICNGCPIECPRCNKKNEGCNCTHYESDEESDDDLGNDSDEDHFIEPTDDWTYAEFEINYRKLLFYHNSLKEENQGAHEEINGLKIQLTDAREKALDLLEIAKKKDEEIISLKFQLEKATADALSLNTANIAQDDKIDNLEIDLIFIKKENNKLKRKLKDEENDNQQIIEERDDLKNELDLLKLTNENLNTEIKDLKIYANDNEENFFRVNKEYKELDDENTKILSELEDAKQNAEADAEMIKELEDTITCLQLEKEIICKQNEELSEKVKYFRQETLNQVGKRKKETDEKDKIIQELKRKLSDVDIERCNYKSELGCIRRDFKEITTLKENFERELNDIKKELSDLQQENAEDAKDRKFILSFYLLTSEEMDKKKEYTFKDLIIKLEHHILSKFMYKDRSEKLEKELEELKKSKL